MSPRRALLALSTLLLVAPAQAETASVGARLEAITLVDQHGAVHEVDATVRGILFSRDMAGGTIIRDALVDKPAGYLESRAVVYVAEISGMPELVARLFALPKMRKRSYLVLLDREGVKTSSLPDEEGRGTLIRLDSLQITEIVSMESPQHVESELAAMLISSPAPSP